MPTYLFTGEGSLATLGRSRWLRRPPDAILIGPSGPALASGLMPSRCTPRQPLVVLAPRLA